jgi:hypothetical protein
VGTVAAPSLPIIAPTVWARALIVDQFADQSLADLALHLNRETMHHGGEIGTLRDLHRATGARTRSDRIGRR